MNQEDERAIVAVLLRYATGIDRRDWPLFATCFAEDVMADYGKLGRWHGRDAIVDHMAKAHEKFGTTMHRLTNFVVEGHGDEAIATSYIDALLMPLASGGAVRRAHGSYEDRLVREADGWKIKSRRFVAALISDSPL